jgi:hypothetical protein
MIPGCSTAGEICGTEVLFEPLIAAAVNFEHTQIKAARANLHEFKGSSPTPRRDLSKA